MSASRLYRDNPIVKKCPVFADHRLRKDKDMYVLLSGDSIFTHQYSVQNASEGVAAVPPNCDKRAFGGIMWEIIQYGSPRYRRFDYGKSGLVGHWDERWNGADAPFFIENGTFETYYHSGKNNSYDYINNFTNLRYTTKVTRPDCPIRKFGEDDGNTNTPKRISNSAHASVSFVIPSGYEKFDFLYETNAQADHSVTVYIKEGDGKVKVNPIERDFTINMEANGITFSMMEFRSEDEDGYDSAIPGKRLFFEKESRDDEITVTIKKSADTSTYLMYWGVAYWGTEQEPFSIHVLTSARGNSRMSNIYANRYYRYKGVVPRPDLIVQECTLINNSTDSTDSEYYLEQHALVRDFIRSLNSEYFYVIPNSHVDRLTEPFIRYWDTAKAQIVKDNDVYMDVQDAIYRTWVNCFSQQGISWREYFVSLMHDGVCHPNDKGTAFYEKLLDSAFEIAATDR
ncbi:MAG: hypothetical protein K0R28_826 [Paenibacillus sp.]|jgi:hypothetical protein|nr:hypothetical protein [Paenibacillus sp.]